MHILLRYKTRYNKRTVGIGTIPWSGHHYYYYLQRCVQMSPPAERAAPSTPWAHAGPRRYTTACRNKQTEQDIAHRHWINNTHEVNWAYGRGMSACIHARVLCLCPTTSLQTPAWLSESEHPLGHYHKIPGWEGARLTTAAWHAASSHKAITRLGTSLRDCNCSTRQRHRARPSSEPGLPGWLC